MFEKLFGPPPQDMDDKQWKLHWAAAMAAIGGALFVLLVAYVMWSVSVDLGPGTVR